MRQQKLPKVTKKQLANALQRLCNAVGTTSRGFDVNAIDGGDQWALKHNPGAGWMVVCGLGGCGAALTRWNGYIRYRWNMLMALEIAQESHAAMAWMSHLLQHGGEMTSDQRAWLGGHFTKVCVQVNSEAELREVHQRALDAGLTSHLITDIGATEFHGVPTLTCCAIGPHADEVLRPITGHLSLY